MSIIIHPVSTEKALRMMEADNKLVFIVERKASKRDIRNAIEKQFKAKVVAVNTVNSIDGSKRAIVQFAKESPAIDIATNLGLM